MKTKKRMGAYRKKSSLVKSASFCLLLFIGLIVARCAKDRLVSDSGGIKTLSVNSPDLKTRLDAIKDSYEKQKLQQKLQPDQSDKLSWSPDWEHPHIQLVNDSVSYVFYQLLGQVVVKGKAELAKQVNGKLYLMVKNESEFYKAFYYDPKANPNEKIGKDTKEFDLKLFTGNLILSSLQNGQNYILDYSNGHLSDSYQKKGVLAIKKMQSVKGTTSYWQQECNQVVRNCTYSSLAPSWCGGIVNIVFSATCSWPQSTCGDTYSLVDSDEGVVCEDKWFPDPPEPIDTGGGEGGNGDGGVPKSEVKYDNLLKDYPCMVKEVLNKLETNQAYAKLIQPFEEVKLPDGTTFVMQGFPNLEYDSSVQDYGASTPDGKTKYSLAHTGQVTATSSKIQFNQAAISNASQLLLQVTAIHETGHAYINYYLQMGKFSHPIDIERYSTWAINIVNFEDIAKTSAVDNNFRDHSIMLETYFDKIWGILKDINGSAYSDKEYQMAALYGLDNPGDTPKNPLVNGVNLFDIYKGVLNKSYNNIKTKYGITDAEVNGFNLANLKDVSADKKLPTDCPK